MKGLIAEEKCFAWKVQQDMLRVGSRIHRQNAERRCMISLDGGQICSEMQTLEHLFRTCDSVVGVYEQLTIILNNFLERQVSYNEIIHFSFNHRNKKKLICALWFAVKVMFIIFHNKCRNKSQILRDIIKEIEWNIDMNRKLGSVVEIMLLKQIISGRL